MVSRKTPLRDIHCKAYQLALGNAEKWLDIASVALQKGHFGQAYSITITANEEIGKAYLSWMACEGFIPTNEELLNDVYWDHHTKTAVTLFYHYEQIAQDLMKSGLIDPDDALNAIVTTSQEDVAANILELAEEIEKDRRMGMYVDLIKDDNRKVVGVQSPNDISRERAVKFHKNIFSYLEGCQGLFDIVSKNEEVKELLAQLIQEEIRTSKPF